MKKDIQTLADATSTPLASIFGSGFLVIVPILAGAVGLYSVVAMAGVCALAYAVGSVIRYNIKHAEPVLAEKPSEMTLSFERLSDIALVLAYVISVCLYLHILASFVLGSFHLDTELNENLVTTGILVVIMVIGLTKGLDVLGALEKWALSITHQQMKARWGTVLVGFGALALTWSANTLEIIAIASRAFAFYYLLQCLVAATVSRSMPQRLGILTINEKRAP